VKQIIEFCYWEIILPLWRTPSRLIFGNFIGFRRNIMPRLGLFIKSFKYKTNKNCLGYKLANQLNKDGYLIKKKYRKDFTQEISEQYHRAFLNKENLVEYADGGAIFIKKPLEHIPSIESFLDSKIDHILRDYFKGMYHINSIRAWRIRHIENDNPNKDLGISNAYHTDGAGCKNIQIFILVSDKVDRNSGSTKFLNKKDTINLVRKPFYFSRKFLTKKILEKIHSKTRLFEGSSGDICFLNTQVCLHGASIPERNSYRDVIAISAKPYSKYVKTNQLFRMVPEDYQI